MTDVLAGIFLIGVRERASTAVLKRVYGVLGAISDSKHSELCMRRNRGDFPGLDIAESCKSSAGSNEIVPLSEGIALCSLSSSVSHFDFDLSSSQPLALNAFVIIWPRGGDFLSSCMKLRPSPSIHLDAFLPSLPSGEPTMINLS